MTDPKWDETADGTTVTFDAPAFRADRFYVYIAWGKDRSRPLYVGKGNRPFTRIGLHLAQATWAGEVVEFECHPFLSPEDALEAENCAIYELNPIHNVIRMQPRWLFHRKMLASLEKQEAERKADEKAHKANVKAYRRAHVRIPRAGLPMPELKKEPVVSPHPRKRLRRQKWKAELFTADQLEIIRRVQNRGRPAA